MILQEIQYNAKTIEKQWGNLSVSSEIFFTVQRYVQLLIYIFTIIIKNTSGAITYSRKEIKCFRYNSISSNGKIYILQRYNINTFILNVI